MILAFNIVILSLALVSAIIALQI
eukprot:SAG22_NODE_5715_length_966_cov_0.891580_1_plen_23_part_10